MTENISRRTRRAFLSSVAFGAAACLVVVGVGHDHDFVGSVGRGDCIYGLLHCCGGAGDESAAYRQEFGGRAFFAEKGFGPGNPGDRDGPTPKQHE